MSIRLTFLFIIAGVWLACQSPRKATGAASTSMGGIPIDITSADSLAGLNATRKSDCVTCHKVDERLQGPSFNDIAKRYQPNQEQANTLARKIINGGLGSWGNIPMTPHSAMSIETAETIVKYILSLKK